MSESLSGGFRELDQGVADVEADAAASVQNGIKLALQQGVRAESLAPQNLLVTREWRSVGETHAFIVDASHADY